MEADEDRLSINTFEDGKTYLLTYIPAARPAVGTLSLFNIQRQDDS
jgi:hypothetical protein